MKVLSIHERKLKASAIQVGSLIDSLASKDDRLWPKQMWPRMEFDCPLVIGAKGRHGPIRYFVEAYTPSESISFRFTGPKGFDGYHGYEILDSSNGEIVLRHILEMNTHGPALLSWPLFYRPMHDALIEDSLTTAEVSLSLKPTVQAWSVWVKVLRWIVSGGRGRPQILPSNGFQSMSASMRHRP